METTLPKPHYLVAWCVEDNNIDPPYLEDYYIVTDNLEEAERKYADVVNEKDTYSANIATITKSTDPYCHDL